MTLVEEPHGPQQKTPKSPCPLIQHRKQKDNGATHDPPAHSQPLIVCYTCNTATASDGDHIMCDLCNEWYHASCQMLTDKEAEAAHHAQHYCCKSCETLTQQQSEDDTSQPSATVNITTLAIANTPRTDRQANSSPAAITPSIVSCQNNTIDLTTSSPGRREIANICNRNQIDSSAAVRTNTPQNRQGEARSTQHDERQEDREKANRAKEKYLNKWEQTLRKQQLQQTEISLQNASLIAQVAKLEDRIKSQQEEIHNLNIQILASSRPSHTYSQERQQTTGTDGSTTNMLLALIIPLLINQRQQSDSSQVGQAIQNLATTVNHLSTTVSQLEERIRAQESAGAQPRQQRQNSWRQQTGPKYPHYKAKYYSHQAADVYDYKHADVYDYKHRTNRHLEEESRNRQDPPQHKGPEIPRNAHARDDETDAALRHLSKEPVMDDSDIVIKDPNDKYTKGRKDAPGTNVDGTPLQPDLTYTVSEKETEASHSHLGSPYKQTTRTHSNSQASSPHFLELLSLNTKPPPLGSELSMWKD